LKSVMREPKLTIQASFEAILLEAVDEGMMVIGESPKAAMYVYIEGVYSLAKEEIPQRLQDFSSAVQKIFGSGGLVIEKLILRRLCEKLNVNYGSVRYKGFQAAVEEVRERSAGPM